MPILYTEIKINAPIDQVWQALFHKERWLRWNTFLFDRDASQPFEVSKAVKLSVLRHWSEGELEFQPIVTAVKPGVCLSWQSQRPGFQHRYTFELQEIGIQRTQYVHREEFSGWLTRLMLPFIGEDESKGMARMAWELKRYVEKL